MFMVKEEYTNARKLLKLKLKAAKRSYLWFFIIASFIFLSNLVPTVIKIWNNDAQGATPHNMSDFSMIFLLGAGVLFFILMITYRQENDVLSVFPQTNSSRFVSSLLFNYLFAFALGMTALVMYLCNFAVISLISHFRGDVYFALAFDIGFVAVGLLTFLTYAFLIVAVFGLVGAILRKWTYYAGAVVVLALSLLLAQPQIMFKNISDGLAFITKEPVPAAFFLKGIAVLIVITAISLIINYRTVYYKSRAKIPVIAVVLVCAGGTIVSMWILTAMMFGGSGGIAGSAEATRIDPSQTIRVDVSHLPKGSKVNVESENVFFPEHNVSYNYNHSECALIAFGEEKLDSLQGNTIVISYSLPRYKINGIELTDYANLKLEAYLEGNTLHIVYTLDDAQVVFLPIWGMARQFGCYVDKGAVFQNPWVFSSGGGGGNLEISVE